MTRRSIWKKLGGLDEAYGIGTFEDIHYSLSVREMGYNILVNPKAMGIHYTGASAETYQVHFPLDYNRMIFLQKWSQTLKWTEWEHY